MRLSILLTLTLLVSVSGCNAQTQQQDAVDTVPAQQAGEVEYTRQEPFVKRVFDPEPDGQWIGRAVCYGPHRDGQSPTGDQPTPEQVLEDLQIMGRHWKMLRMYSSQGSTEVVLELIREHDLDMKVVVGAWIGTEAKLDETGNITERFPEAVTANRAEVDTAIRLANEYPEIVAAITIGNETQVFWSFHKVRTPVLVNYIRQARAQTQAPVSTADVFSYWARPESKVLADELDFVVTHIYAMWHKQPFDNAMAWTKQQYAIGVANHPDHALVIGEAGWATQIHHEGDEIKYITDDASEDRQQAFYRDFIEWTSAERIPNFYFEAFDESWKGDDHPDGVEKHWGLYNADRSPKKAVRGEN